MGQEIELNSNIRKSLAVPSTTDMKSSFVFIDDNLLLSAWIDAVDCKVFGTYPSLRTKLDIHCICCKKV